MVSLTKDIGQLFNQLELAEARPITDILKIINCE